MDQNKTDLFQYLSDVLVQSFDHGEKQLVVTHGDTILCKPQLSDILYRASGSQMQGLGIFVQKKQHN